jgi:hypothetical protein
LLARSSGAPARFEQIPRGDPSRSSWRAVVDLGTDHDARRAAAARLLHVLVAEVRPPLAASSGFAFLIVAIAPPRTISSEIPRARARAVRRVQIPRSDRRRGAVVTSGRTGTRGLPRSPKCDCGSARTFAQFVLDPACFMGRFPTTRRDGDGSKRARIYINRSNQLVLESKADMQKRGKASLDDGGFQFAGDAGPARRST